MSKVYACSDLHGTKEAWEKIKNILKPEDTLYFLGDAIDRNPYGIEIAQEILNRPNTYYLLGNHEDMMKNAIVSKSNYDLRVWYKNGGRITHESFKKLTQEEQDNFLFQIQKMPRICGYKNANGLHIHMSHAGYDFEGEGIFRDSEGLIWDRNHYLGDWWDETKYPNDIILHGHTPIPYLIEDREEMAFFTGRDLENKEYTNGAYIYCKGHKIDIDCGVHYTNQTTLLDLDTLQSIPIILDNIN